MARSKKRNADIEKADSGKLESGCSQPPLQTRLLQEHEELPESERKLADLLLDFPGEIAAYRATELAKLAGTSKAAVTRLIRRLGYTSFKEAQIDAREVKHWGSPLYLLHKHDTYENYAARIQWHIEQDTSNLMRTFDRLDENTFNAVIEALATSARIWLIGYRNSYYLAGYARWQFIQVRSEVHLLPLGGETLAEYMADLRADDMLLVVGFRRRVSAIERAMEIAQRSGARILFITDPTARANPAATWTLRCEVRGNDPIDAYVSAVSVLHFLSVALIERMGVSGRSRLTQIEKMHDELNDFATIPRHAQQRR